MAWPALVIAENVYSATQIFCADYEQRHKKNIMKMRSFVSVGQFRNEKKEEWEAVRPTPGIQSSHLWYKKVSMPGKVATERTADKMFE